MVQHFGYQQQPQTSTFGQYLFLSPASTGSGENKHACEVCGAGFSRPSELKVRSFLPITCCFIDVDILAPHRGIQANTPANVPSHSVSMHRSFSTYSNLGRHVRSIHPREREQAMRLSRSPGGIGVLRAPDSLTTCTCTPQSPSRTTRAP